MIAAWTLALSFSAAASQQDALTPTDVLGFGQFSATGSFRMNAGKGTFTNPVSDIDFDTEAFLFQLDAAVGLGMGFEVELSIPWQFKGRVQGDGTFTGLGAEIDQDVSGFGDLTLTGVYRLLKEDTLTPQWILGIIVQAPTGNDRSGQPKFTVGGVTLQNEEDGAIGSGVWSYGFGTAISKSFGLVEPYGGLSYVFGGTRTENGVREDRSDVLGILLGAEWHVTPDATIDTRALFQFVGQDGQEENAAKVKEASHWTYGGQALLYVHLGGGFTLVAGGGVQFTQNHESNDVQRADVMDAFLYQLEIGLHFFFGAK